MPHVLNANASIGCGHGGTVGVGAGQGALRAGGAPVLVAGDLDGRPISGCATPDSAGVTAKCWAVVSVLGGASATLFAGGRPVLLDTVRGVTNGVPPGVLVVLSPGQATLRAH
ncbi:hypothetical protein LO762_08350 [Actinocorallia sp. API 0066]|uniref:hypothetical protein n=1 Tax=Actinocorallia sp. API 0066 TaxID=2896846 RepID=UPI001E346B65|nr:hypothetical protein [Actinocorallia sp. API 0066]MCD0449197.1 hypothetical protein [Actinocorallia sp. API 0066]